MKNGKESLKIISIDADTLSIEFFNLNNFKDTVQKLKDSGFEIFGTEKTASQLRPRIKQPDEFNDYEIYNRYSKVLQRSL